MVKHYVFTCDLSEDVDAFELDGLNFHAAHKPQLACGAVAHRRSPENEREIAAD